MTIHVGWGIVYMRVTKIMTEFRDRGYFEGGKISASIDEEKDKAVFRIDGISLDNARFLGSVLDIATDDHVEWEHNEENER